MTVNRFCPSSISPLDSVEYREWLMETDEPTLEQDLLETSESVFHHRVASYQLERATTRLRSKEQLGDWAREECEKKTPKANIKAMVNNAWQQLLVHWKGCLDEKVRILALEKEARDAAIRVFCQEQAPTAPHQKNPAV